MIHWSLDTLLRAGCSPLIVVIPPDLDEDPLPFFDSYDDVITTTGGDTRQASIAKGVEEVTADVVVVHDAARPLIDGAMVREVTAAVEKFDGAVSAVPVDETLKLVEAARVSATIDRAGLWRSQTPQAFRTETLRRCHESAFSDGFSATDDAALLEHYGYSVAVVEGRRSNIKVTWPEDFDLAEAYLSHRGTREENR